MNLPIAMTFQRAPTPFPHFMPLDPARTQFSHGPNNHPGSLPRVAVLHQGHRSNQEGRLFKHAPKNSAHLLLQSPCQP